jgi:hypothetical protein
MELHLAQERVATFLFLKPRSGSEILTIVEEIFETWSPSIHTVGPSIKLGSNGAVTGANTGTL